MNLPKEFTLLEAIPPLWYDQRNTNSCVGEALAFILSYYSYNEEKAVVKYSPYYIYWHARYLRRAHLKDEGAYLLDGITAVQRWWACEEEVWPSKTTLLGIQPSPEAYEDAYSRKGNLIFNVLRTIEEMKMSLYNRIPFTFGFYVPASLKKKKNTREIVLDVPPPNETIAGGHAVVAIGYSDYKDAFLCRNSWGYWWGNEGNFWITYNYFEKGLASEGYAIIIRKE